MGNTDIVERFFGWLAFLLIAGVILWGLKHDRAIGEECQRLHLGLPYVEESPYASTAAGCKITKITKLDHNCSIDQILYYTSCPGSLNWDHQVGKTTVHEYNQTGP